VVVEAVLKKRRIQKHTKKAVQMLNDHSMDTKRNDQGIKE
jgi:hypothetical protein